MSPVCRCIRAAGAAIPRSVTQEILKVAREKCGFEELRAGQEEAIRGVVQGRDTLVVQPTGSGKSAIYQIAGLLLEGPTLVISPLIALQKDQLDSIQQNGLGEAASVNSQERVRDVRETFEKLEQDQMEFLFLAPEQLKKPEVLDRLKNTPPSLFVVDEAHCISEWGHDFRPDYLRLGSVAESLGHPPILAMTATAAPDVRDEIISRLGMRNPLVVVRGFDRPNIFLRVEHFSSEGEKRRALLQRVEDAPKPGIVYVATRKHAEELAQALNDRGLNALSYHGGLPAKERTEIQNSFMRGDTPVMVATNAFGMGVDKSDVRFVYHFDIADSLDSYYQEIGRAGRDDEPAEAILFYRHEDLRIPKFLKSGGKVDEKTVTAVNEVLERAEEPVAIQEIQKATNLSGRKTEKIVTRLEEAGQVKRLDDGQVVAEEDADLAEAVEQVTAEEQRRREYEATRLEKMQAYAELADCRREYLLHYFGEDEPVRCGKCDNCLKHQSAAPQNGEKKVVIASFPPHSRVLHSELGRGVVQKLEGDKIEVLFDEGGTKTLSLTHVQQHQLLERA